MNVLRVSQQKKKIIQEIQKKIIRKTFLRKLPKKVTS